MFNHYKAIKKKYIQLKTVRGSQCARVFYHSVMDYGILVSGISLEAARMLLLQRQESSEPSVG